MDTFLDILINMSPIILILGIYGIHKFCKEKKKYWFVLLFNAIILFGIAVMIAGDGYGDFYISITILIDNPICLYGKVRSGFYANVNNLVVV